MMEQLFKYHSRVKISKCLYKMKKRRKKAHKQPDNVLNIKLLASLP